MKRPKRTDFAYLRGWFKVQTKGNEREAARLAREYARGLVDRV